LLIPRLATSLVKLNLSNNTFARDSTEALATWLGQQSARIEGSRHAVVVSLVVVWSVMDGNSHVAAHTLFLVDPENPRLEALILRECSVQLALLFDPKHSTALHALSQLSEFDVAGNSMQFAGGCPLRRLSCGAIPSASRPR
jgi:hypothetical protein